MRNVIQTINNIPEDYTGRVNVLINDINPYVTLRNLLILQILGTTPDKSKAVDVALHMWYSAFIPQDYHLQLMAVAAPFVINEGRYDVQLGEKAALVAVVGDQVRLLCAQLCSVEYGIGDAANELGRVRCAQVSLIIGA